MQKTSSLRVTSAEDEEEQESTAHNKKNISLQRRETGRASNQAFYGSSSVSDNRFFCRFSFFFMSHSEWRHFFQWCKHNNTFSVHYQVEMRNSNMHITRIAPMSTVQVVSQMGFPSSNGFQMSQAQFQLPVLRRRRFVVLVVALIVDNIKRIRCSLFLNREKLRESAELWAGQKSGTTAVRKC